MRIWWTGVAALALSMPAAAQELAPEVQARVMALWDQVTNDNIYQLTDFAGYKQDFLRLFGFEIDGVDYEADTDPAVEIRGLA